MMHATRRGRTLESRRGTAAAAVIIALVLLQLVVVAAVVGGARDHDLTDKRLQSLRAEYAAEGGVNMAVREFCRNSDEDGDGGIGSIASGASLGSQPNIGNGRVTATIATSGANSTVTVSSTATLATRQINLALVRPSSGATSPYLRAECFTLGSAPNKLSGVVWSGTPTSIGTSRLVNFISRSGVPAWLNGPSINFGIRYFGKITIPTTGTWTFYTKSDDGSSLSVNGTLVVNNDFVQSATERSGSITLTAGTYDFETKLFNNGGNYIVTASWAGPGVAKTIIPASAFTSTAVALAPLVAGTSLQMLGNSVSPAASIDAFDSSLGAYGGSNIYNDKAIAVIDSTTAGSFKVDGGATLNGSAVVGPGGTPGTVVTITNGGQVTGTKTAAASGSTIFCDALPVTIPASEGNYSLANSTATWSTDRHFGSAMINKSTITVSGNINVQCDSGVTLKGTSQIIIPSGSSLTLWCATTLDIQDTTEVNISGSGIPSRAIFNIIGGGAFTVSGSAKVCAQVTNQRGSMSIDGNTVPGAEFFGTLRGATFTMSNRAKVHLDTFGTATSGSGSSSGTGSMQITSWTQVR